MCEALVRVIPDLKGEAKEKYLEAQKTGASRQPSASPARPVETQRLPSPSQASRC